jgi:hypothetical protein
MNESNRSEIIAEAEQELGFRFPEEWKNYLLQLPDSAMTYGSEEWIFPFLEEEGRNFIVDLSKNFREEWKVDGVIFASNGIGDYLLFLPDQDEPSLMPQVFVLLHETAEVKLFSSALATLLKKGPADYFYSDDCYMKLEDGELIYGDETLEEEDSDEAEALFEDDDYKLRWHLDELLDNERTDRANEIIDGLNKLIGGESGYIGWAINRLSDIYFKGFGPIPRNIEKALEYNQMAINLGNPKAYSNRAACYFYGIGVDKDINKALELATKANELSKSNMFAETWTGKKDTGLYEDLVKMIQREVAKGKKEGE